MQRSKRRTRSDQAAPKEGADMADTNLNPRPVQTQDLSAEAQEVLRKFSNHLYARSGMAEGTINLTIG